MQCDGCHVHWWLKGVVHFAAVFEEMAVAKLGTKYKVDKQVG